MTRNCFRRLFIGFIFLLSTPGLVLSEDYLPEEAIVLLFGDLNRPADVLLGESEAKMAKIELGIRLKQYLAIQEALLQLRSPLIDMTDERKAQEADKEHHPRSTARLEESLKQTESKIRAISDKLDSSWLTPIRSNLDDKQATDLLNLIPQVQVTIRSKNGVVLNPTKLTLVSPTAGSFRFAEIRPGAYIANPPVGEYQLGWQLTDKSTSVRLRRMSSSRMAE